LYYILMYIRQNMFCRYKFVFCEMYRYICTLLCLFLSFFFANSLKEFTRDICCFSPLFQRTEFLRRKSENHSPFWTNCKDTIFFSNNKQFF